MDAKKYISFFYGNKEEAIVQLEKSVVLYDSSPNNHTPKVAKRIIDYKNLLTEIKSLINEPAQN
ncbi:MAG: hypothetical protein H7Z76_11565 [Methylotenera sp.]|nr:hypothetical protein [Flavobacterium sp.]